MQSKKAGVCEDISKVDVRGANLKVQRERPGTKRVDTNLSPRSIVHKKSLQERKSKQSVSSGRLF